MLFCLLNTSFAEWDNINLSLNKNIIDNSNEEFNTHLEWKFDLFSIKFPNFININWHESRTWIYQKDKSNHERFFLEKNPKLLDFFIDKIWIDKIKKYLDTWILHIIWDYNKTWDHNYKITSKYYLSSNTDKVEWNYLDVWNKYNIENTSSWGLIKLEFSPVDINVFNWYRIWARWPYPTISFFDNTILPQDIYIYTNLKKYYPTIKYVIQWYKINTPFYYPNKMINSTKVSYVIIPYYEFNIDLPKWNSEIDINYKKFILNYDEISIYESY